MYLLASHIYFNGMRRIIDWARPDELYVVVHSLKVFFQLLTVEIVFCQLNDN